MAIQLKIVGATPKQGRSLCVTCKHATIVRGQNMEEHVECGQGMFSAYRSMVPFRVAECNQYHPTNMPWLHEMERIAWHVEARRRGPVGFEKPPDQDDSAMEVIVTPPKQREGHIPFLDED